MNTNDDAKEAGTDLASTLLIVFIVLKLTGLISWSWWWVLAPLWITLAVAALCIVIALLVTGWQHS